MHGSMTRSAQELYVAWVVVALLCLNVVTMPVDMVALDILRRPTKRAASYAFPGDPIHSILVYL